MNMLIIYMYTYIYIYICTYIYMYIFPLINTSDALSKLLNFRKLVLSYETKVHYIHREEEVCMSAMCSITQMYDMRIKKIDPTSYTISKMITLCSL